MVMNNAPAFLETLEYKRKHAAYISFFARKVPFSQDESCIGTKQADFQVGKVELSHLLAVRIAFLVALANSIKAPSDAAAARESQFVRVPVAFKEGVHSAVVPCGLLSCKDGPDCRLIVGMAQAGIAKA